MFKFTWFVKMKRKLNILFYKLLNRVEDPCSIYLILFILILMIAIFFTYFLNLGIYFLNLEVYTLKLNISILIFYLFYENHKYSERYIIRLIQKFILYIFCIFLSMFLMISLEVSLYLLSENNCSHSAIFIFLSKLSNKIPSPIKAVGKLQLGIFLVMKLLGFSFIDVWTNPEKLKIYIAVLTIFVILSQLLSLFFLFRFSKGKNINCLEILPNFLINWLNDLKEMSLNNEVFISTKESLYLHIGIYIVLLIFLVLI